MPIRQPVVAGRFYPASPEELKKEIAGFKKREATEKTAPETLAAEKTAPLMIMLPHAGYVFCGRVIAETLARAELPDTLIMLGPNHTGRGAPLSVWPGGAWLTPLGAVPVDEELTGELTASDAGFQADTAAHAFEHSLEVLLPFLQDKNPNLRIAPVAVGTGDPAVLRSAATALADILSRNKAGGGSMALLVSSDMNHFADEKATIQKDGLALERMRALDPDGLLRTVRANNISMCGVCPAALALYAALRLGAREAEVTAYSTSAEASGDSSRVVGYAGLIIR